MNRRDNEYYRCPKCRGELAWGDGALADEVDNAELLCTSCKSKFEVRNGVPRFVPSSNYADSFGFQWNIHAETQLDSHSGLPVSRRRVKQVTGWPDRMDGLRILEAGSGAGRFTEVLASSGAELFSFDYSMAVDANQRNNGHYKNLHLFQGDIFNMPFAEGQFDKVLCLGVLQHTPDPEGAFKSLAAQVKPGGELVIDVYARNMLALLQWKYVLRPITKRMDQQKLYALVTRMVDRLLPLAIRLRRIAGRAGARLVPIVEYSYLGLSPDLNREWAILDTFDMYSPAHDHPQSVATVRRWFSEAGFVNVDVRRGPNGVTGKGARPEMREQKDVS